MKRLPAFALTGNRIAACIILSLLTGCGGRAVQPQALPPVSGGSLDGTQRASQTAGPVAYRVVDLGANLYPTAVNDKGWVVGGVQGSDAFLYRNGSLKLLGALPGDADAEAFGINDSGTIVGTSYGSPPSYHEHAVVYRDDGAVKALGTGSGTDSAGVAVNDSGTLVGDTFTDGNYCFGDAVIFDGHGGIKRKIGPRGYSAVRGINDAGAILYDILFSDGGPCEGQISMMIYPGKRVVSMPPNNNIDNSNNANAINAYGHVVGYFRDVRDNFAGFYDHDGKSEQILYNRQSATWPTDINRYNWIVGTIESGTGLHAFLWTNGKFSRLDDLVENGTGWHFEIANRISDNKYIVGTGSRFGSEHGFLLVPQ